MRKILEGFAFHVLQPVHKAAIMAMGLYTLIWGLWVANPFWVVFTHAQIFSALGIVAPEVFWGCFAIICGLLIIWGATRQSVKSLRRGAAVAFFHWCMIGAFYFIGDWQNTGGITCVCIALYAAYLYLNIRVNTIWRGRLDSELFR